MALNKVEICGVNTKKLPMLTQEEKMLFLLKSKRVISSKRNLYQRKPASCAQRDQTFRCKQ